MDEYDLFAWTYDGYEVVDSDDLVRESPSYEYENCSEVGCNKGMVLLLYSRVKCSKCNGTGKVKKVK